MVEKILSNWNGVDCRNVAKGMTTSKKTNNILPGADMHAMEPIQENHCQCVINQPLVWCVCMYVWKYVRYFLKYK